jgi:hypothetical protein
MKFMATIKSRTPKNFSPSSLFILLDPGFGMEENQNPGSGINISDPQYWA